MGRVPEDHDSDGDGLGRTSMPPYSAIGLVRVHIAGGWAVGTGALIDPQHVLTCSHLLVARGGEVATQISFYPGFNRAFHPARGWPGGSLAAVCAFAAPEYWTWDAAYYTWDVGLIRLSASVAIPPPGAPFPLQAVNEQAAGALAKRKIDIAGYPRDRNGEMHWESCVVEGLSFPDRLLYHQLESRNGDSGAPLYSYDALADSVRLCGVHIQGLGVGEHFDKMAVLLTPEVTARLTTARRKAAAGAFAVYQL